MDEASSKFLIEHLIKPSQGDESFGTMLQKMHQNEVSLCNVNLSSYFGAFIAITSLMEAGLVGQKFGVSNVNFFALTAKNRRLSDGNSDDGTSTDDGQVFHSHSNKHRKNN